MKTKINDIGLTPVLTLLAMLFFGATITAAPGDLDPTFGVGGKLIDGSGYGLYDVAIQPDGKIVAVGPAAGGSEGTQIAVARYNIDGSPDTTFGGTGRVFIDHYQVAVDVAIQPDGKIVVAGRNPDGEVFGELVRLNSDGSLDTSFGTNGIVAASLPSVAAILPDGKLLIAQFARLSRLNANGSFDTTFGPCEPGVTSLHYLYNRTESVIQTDGRILTAFTFLVRWGTGFPAESRFGVFRCNADGTLDTGFGSGGVVITPISSGLDVAHSIAIQMDGKIVVTGQSQTNSNSDWRLTVVRYHPNGSLDTGFGTGGIATTPTGITYWNPPLDAVAIQTDGKIVAATTIENGSNRDFALVRYNPNGSLDTTFNGTGKVITPITNGNDYAHSVAIQADGKIVVAGAGDYGSDFYDLVVRYQGDGARPTSCPNPIDCAEPFVSQHYHDFLNREPDPDGLAFWANEITLCGADQQCIEAKRINVSAAFFLSIEFQQTGYLVYRFHKAAYGNLPGAPVPVKLSEFLPDTQKIGQGVIVNQAGWETVLENNKQAFSAEFVQRPRFIASYPVSLMPTQFVDALFANAGVTPSNTDRAAAINESGGTLDTSDAAARARALRRVAENSALQQQEFNRAFVLMQYFGYLRRNPNDPPEPTLDFQGYNFWLNKLNQFNGSFQDAEMVKAFLVSSEYRQRFGQP